MENYLKNSELTKNDVDTLINSWSLEKNIKKNQFLLERNQKENFLYFVVSGCIASIVEVESKSLVLGFGYSGSVITSFISFVNQVPTDLSLKALSDTKLLCISKGELDK